MSYDLNLKLKTLNLKTLNLIPSSDQQKGTVGVNKKEDKSRMSTTWITKLNLQ